MLVKKPFDTVGKCIMCSYTLPKHAVPCGSVLYFQSNGLNCKNPAINGTSDTCVCTFSNEKENSISIYVRRRKNC